MDILNVSLTATLIAGIAAFAFGFLWHMVLGKTWMRLMRVTAKDIKKAQSKSMGPSYALAFLAQLIIAWALGVLIVLTELSGAAVGAAMGFVVWIVIASYALNGVLWENRSWGLWGFNNLYSLCLFLLMGAIMGAWA